MNDDLREEARRKLIQEKAGLISQAELVSWADERLLELEDAPDFLISISMREPLDHVPRLDLVKDRALDDDCSSLATCMMRAYEAGEIGFDEIEAISLKMTQILKDTEVSYLDFMWISDELHLVDCGVKEEEKSHRDTIEMLRKIAQMPYNPSLQPTS